MLFWSTHLRTDWMILESNPEKCLTTYSRHPTMHEEKKEKNYGHFATESAKWGLHPSREKRGKQAICLFHSFKCFYIVKLFACSSSSAGETEENRASRTCTG